MNIRRRAARLLAFLVALVLAAGLVAASPAPPAVAAAQDLHIAMMSDSSTTTVGTPITLRARVDLGGNADDDEDPIRAAGWAVQFQSLNSDDAVVWTSPTVLTNAAGAATYEYRRPTPGTETIRARLVTTGCDNIVSDPRTFRWQQAPVAAFEVTKVAGRSAHFDASASEDPDGDIVDYAWTFGDGDTGRGESPTHPYREDGSYTVTLTVTDNDGAKNAVSHTVVIPNVAPVASFVEQRTDWYTTQLDASESHDPDGRIVTYEWDFGDGHTGTGETPSHTYARHYDPDDDPESEDDPYDHPAEYRVTLTVTDNRGATAEVSHEVRIPNRSPSAWFESTVTDLTATFDGSESFDDGSIDSYEWDFGDGQTGGGINPPPHTYAAPGTYDVTLVVIDNQGADDEVTFPVRVPNAAPIAVARLMGRGTYSITVASTGSMDPDGTLDSLRWDWGEGSFTMIYDPDTSDPNTRSFTYPTVPGTYNITLTATDNQGRSTTTEPMTVRVPYSDIRGVENTRSGNSEKVQVRSEAEPRRDTHIRRVERFKRLTAERPARPRTEAKGRTSAKTAAASAPIAIKLTKSDPRSRTGSVVRLSAKASTTNPQQALAGWQVVFRGTAGGGWVSPPVTTDARGVAEYQRGYKGKATDETITAELIFPACHNIDSNSLDHEWWQPAITLTPTDGQSVVGSSFTLKARLTGADTSPIRNVPLKMTANPSSGATLTREDETDPNGWASFTWIRNAPVTEKILVEELTDDAVPATARTTHRWTKLAEKLTVAASPESSSGRTGSSFWVDVTARMGGHNQAGIAIELTATKAGDSTLTRSTATGPDSHAAFNYTRKKAGGERILVTARFADQTASTTLTRIWKAPKPKVAMTFGPNGTKSEVGTSFEPTATITRAGKPVSGAWVEFSGKLTGSPDAEDSLATDSEGNARFGYSRSTPGTETVTAKAVVDGVPLTRSLVHTWTEQKPKEPAVIDLETETAVPNGDLPISGAGCLPGQQVKVSIGGTKAGSTTADGRGRFKTRVVVPELPLGTHTVRVSCGSVKAEKDIDVNGPQTTKTSVGAKGLATAGFLLSFTMLAGLLLRIGGSRIG